MRDRACEQRRRVAVRVGLGGGARRRDAHHHRLVVAARHEEVVREVDRLRVGLRLQHGGDPRVELLPAGNDHVLVDRLAGQRVPEAVAPGHVRILEQLVRDACLEGLEHVGFRAAGDLQGLHDRDTG